jgi:solute carrier family 8 (sodium/calcium exchanger)
MVNGTFLRIKQICNVCEAINDWDSQPYYKNTPAGNILLSASILFTGLLPEKALRFLNSFCCATITSRAFFQHQKQFLVPAVLTEWDLFQQAIFAQCAAEELKLVIGGDGRADSPGHCAKFGSYTIMELHHKVILDIQLVQVK